MASLTPTQAEMMLMRHPLIWRSPACRRAPTRTPHDHRLPEVYRVLRSANEDIAPTADFVRDAKLAVVEAALFVAEEPQTAKKLATLAGLSDPAEVRRLIHKLH